MELAMPGGVMLFIINSIISRTRRKWTKNKWVEKKTLEDVFDKLYEQGIEVYVHFELGDPWATFDEHLASFVEVGWIQVESFLIQTKSETESSNIILEEKVFISLTESGKKIIANGKLHFPEHEKIIENVINDIVLNKN